MLKTGKAIATLAGLMLAVGVASPALAQGKIGIVDKVKLYGQYPRLKNAAGEIKQDEERLHKMIERSNKQFETAKKEKKPQADLTALHKKLQTEIDAEFQKFQKKALGMEKQLENELDTAIQAEAKQQQLTAVFDKSAVLMGGVDITEGVAKRLASSGAAPQSATK